MKIFKNICILIIILLCCYFLFEYFVNSLLITYFTFIYFLIVAILAYLYKPFKKNYFTKCDIIVPVFNEGKHIYKTIKSVSKSKNKNFNLIVVDDGSTDDTKFWIEKACKDFQFLEITPIFLNKNEGKKHALYKAIKCSSNEIIITIDSDSIISKKIQLKIF